MKPGRARATERKAPEGGGSRVTIKDVARSVGVTPMTVSNVINGKHERVGKRTREMIESAITRLGYRLDLSGRRLRLSKQFLVEMLVVDPSPTFFSDPFTTALIAGLSRYLNGRSYGLIIHGASAGELEKGGQLTSRRTDGTCVLASGDRQERLRIYKRLAAQGDPFIVFQDELPAGMDAASVRQDDAHGGEMLTRHLVAKGCRKIVWLTLKYHWPAFEARRVAVMAALKATKHAAPLTSIALPSLDYAAIQGAVAEFIKRHGLPDAFMCANDQIGIAALNFLIEHGHRVPEDVRITGFNAFDFWLYSRPTLTTIQSPAFAMGEYGGNLMIERLEQGKFHKASTAMPVTLQQGGST
jgi:LacI family transcriptional regulator